MANVKGIGQGMSKGRNWKSDVLNWEMGICNGKRHVTINIEILFDVCLSVRPCICVEKKTN